MLVTSLRFSQNDTTVAVFADEGCQPPPTSKMSAKLLSSRWRHQFDCMTERMMSLLLGEGWTMELERGPDWLYVHLEPGELDREGKIELAEALWRVMENEFTYRMVLEMNDVSLLYSALLGELVLLNRRVLEHGGMLRISGLSATNMETLRCSRLDTYLSCYDSRAAAVMGHIPSQPR